MIISFEGGEGVGKTTHAANLCSYLSNKELPWLSIREPGGSWLSEEVRALFFKEGLDTMTELLLVLASRRQNIVELIEPGLDKGSIVIIDRFIDSTIVYQGIAGGLGIETVRHLMEQTGTWLEPDVTFVMDIDPVKGLKRITPGDKFENRGIDYHYMLRKAFLDIATDRRHRIINADRDSSEVARDIITIVEEFLPHA
ncbi:MAG TPA: dTMP kinase [Deltaproteobacteria bacterium]|nr:dTMP kinase [Deltaproteobacteria bacterium]